MQRTAPGVRDDGPGAEREMSGEKAAWLRSPARAGGRCAAVLACLGAIVLGCIDDRFENGEACLKDQDCRSGFCLAQLCSSPLPSLSDSGSPLRGRDGGRPDGGEAGDATDDARPGALDAEATLDASDAGCSPCP